MSPQPNDRRSEGLKVSRFMMVLSGMAPLFVLWGVQGNDLLPEFWFIFGCGAMVVIPNVFLWARLVVARMQRDEVAITVEHFEDHRGHLIAYLFSILLPLYRQDLGAWRDFAAMCLALGFIVFLFWHLNLHYLNIIYAFQGYRVYTVYPPSDENPFSGKSSFVLLTRRTSLRQGETIIALRLSQLVYLEET